MKCVINYRNGGEDNYYTGKFSKLDPVWSGSKEDGSVFENDEDLSDILYALLESDFLPLQIERII